MLDSQVTAVIMIGKAIKRGVDEGVYGSNDMYMIGFRDCIEWMLAQFENRDPEYSGEEQPHVEA